MDDNHDNFMADIIASGTTLWPTLLLVVNSNLHEDDAYRFHWILLIISIDNSNINVYDSLRKDPSEYQDLQDVFHE